MEMKKNLKNMNSHHQTIALMWAWKVFTKIEFSPPNKNNPVNIKIFQNIIVGSFVFKLWGRNWCN